MARVRNLRVKSYYELFPGEMKIWGTVGWIICIIGMVLLYNFPGALHLLPKVGTQSNVVKVMLAWATAWQSLLVGLLLSMFMLARLKYQLVGLLDISAIRARGAIASKYDRLMEIQKFLAPLNFNLMKLNPFGATERDSLNRAKLNIAEVLAYIEPTVERVRDYEHLLEQQALGVSVDRTELEAARVKANGSGPDGSYETAKNTAATRMSNDLLELSPLVNGLHYRMNLPLMFIRKTCAILLVATPILFILYCLWGGLVGAIPEILRNQ